MPIVDVFSTGNEKVGSKELPDLVFGAEVKEHLFHTIVRYQLAKRRAGTHATKSRARVAGGGKKPYKQKGTGRARQGTRRAPHYTGGGVVFGPHPRSHAFDLPKKVRKAALRSALSRRVEESEVIVFDAFVLDGIKTKGFVQVLDRFGASDLLLVLDEKDEVVLKSSRNVPGVTVLPVDGLNVYDILKHRKLAMTSAAVDRIVERLGV
jgi:large subunit ribosomal protein L4